MQKPSKKGHEDSYMKLLWYCQLQGTEKPSELTKTWILSFSAAEGFYGLCLQGFVKLKQKMREKILTLQILKLRL